VLLTKPKEAVVPFTRPADTVVPLNLPDETVVAETIGDLILVLKFPTLKPRLSPEKFTIVAILAVKLLIFPDENNILCP